MKRMIAGILGTLVAIGLMAPTGGYPSRPQFQRVGINALPSASVSLSVQGATAGGVTAAISGLAGSLFTGQALQVTSPNTAGQSNGIRILAGSNSSDAPLVLTNAANSVNYWIFDGSGGQSASGLSSCGAGCINATKLEQGNVQVLTALPFKVAFATFAGVGSCAINNPPPPSGVSACVRNSAGNYTVTLNAGFASAPNCVANSGSATQFVATTVVSTATTLSLDTWTSSGTIADASSFTLICIGS